MEKKKLRFNIIDAVIILAVAALVAFLAMKVADSVLNPEPEPEMHTVRIRFYHDDVADYVIAQTHVGDPAYDASYAIDLGTVVDIQTGDSAIYEVVDGKFMALSREGRSSVSITVETQAELSPHGVTIDESVYSVGHTLTLRAGGGKYYLPIDNIEVLD